MIPKKSKYALTVTLLALSTACLATGCKKKHDKIDLSGSQAAESTVQTAPVSTTATESESSSSITIEPGIENAQSQGTSAGGAATSLSLSVKTATYQNGNVSIQYPVISDISFSFLGPFFFQFIVSNAEACTNTSPCGTSDYHRYQSIRLYFL